MINGEGTASPDPSFPDFIPLSHDAAVAGEGEESLSSPRYSTCGESELDRYSSANSVMGTPTFSTSLGKHDLSISQFDPFFTTVANLNATSYSSIKDHGSNLGVDDTVDGGTSVPMSFDALGADGLLDDGQVSSAYDYDHSDGEASMFGFGMDDDKRVDFYHDKHLQLPKENNENVLLMNSSVAFGSNDWDDYAQETGANPLVSIGLEDGFWGQKQPTVGYSTDNRLNGNEGRDADTLTAAIIHHSNADHCKENGINVKYIDANIDKVNGINKPVEPPNMCSGDSMYVIEQDFLIENASLNEGLSIKNNGLELEHPCTSHQEASSRRGDHVPESIKLEKTILDLEPLSEGTVGHPHSAPREPTEDNTSFEHRESCLLQLLEEKITMKDLSASNQPAPIKAKSHQLNEFEDDIVHEMEEILLDSRESPGARFDDSSRAYKSQTPPPSRDGSSTASTSRPDTERLLINRRVRIDRVEVIGARQKKGDVSLSERLVGVKEYTVYKIRVWSGEDKWEVERRYRDFFTLYRRLKILYVNQGWILPSPWAYVERESRKIFGNASPTVVSERSVLIQDCLCSLLDSRLSSNHLSPLIWFLSPPTADPRSPASVTDTPKSPFSATEYVENISFFGRTISLVFENWPYRTTKQILEAQHYTCSGCHKHFDDGKTRIWEIVQTLGWGKPRLCEYSGQLFCASCHTNDTAVLPARVLHFWDFVQYPVSQMAKHYLDSIHDQPMLCVSAVNPLLLTKVPALLHVTDVRKKIRAMLPYVHCPFRRTIFKGLGSRRYLLESNDFFALRDLIDLSKGVFAALPVMVETVSRKISEHITEQCLLCCDMGVPCNARQDCVDPSSLIFPFQEGEVERCRSCGLVFHKPCFKKISTCPCGVNFMVYKTKESLTKGATRFGNNERGSVETQSDSWSSVGVLSGLFAKGRREKLLERKPDDNVILMGSLPSVSL